MSVRPNRLDGIAAHIDHPHKLERPRPQDLIRPLVNISHDVPLPLAAGARAVTSQRFNRDKALLPIIPFDGQFVADLLDVRGLHGLS